jgi:uncharacterized protein (TIGR02145 family)
MKRYLLIINLFLGSLTLMGQTLSVTSGGTVIARNAAVDIAGNATITTGATALVGATVSISTNFVTGQDVLGLNGAASGGITSSYNSTTGVLTLSGATTVENYQATLRKVTYTNTSATPTTTARVITFSLNSALPFTGNGHYFEFITSTNITWTDAFDAANLKKYFGLQGYLATITSLAENTFVYSKINAAGWLGGSDAASEGVWKWVCGPESGTQFWNGGINGSAVGGNFTYWHSAQPDNSGGEHYLDFWNGDHWNDYPNTATGSIAGYVVEYGGMTGDPVLHISDNVVVVFAPLVSNLTVTGSNIKWYDAAAGGNLVASTTPLVNGNHYYASQTISGIESAARLDITAAVITVAAPAAGTHTPSKTQVVWNWNTVTGATGYKWSATNLYSSSTDMGTDLTKTETGLTCNTAYYRYVWAYNGSGCVSAVTELTQTTSACMVTISDVDGNVYNTVTIGTQVWMAENLKATKYNDNTAIPNITVNETFAAATTGAYSDYDNTPSNSTTYGRLYNWYAIDNDATTKTASNGGKNICPTGWHVPTIAEWTTLSTYLGGGTVAGAKLKETGTTHWETPNTGATNESGFTGLPAGIRSSSGTWNIGVQTYWWSSSKHSGSVYNDYTYIQNNYNNLSISYPSDPMGFSVRCISDI